MFSQLGPLFKINLRQAESNDTRQNIPHEERQQNRKKHDEAKKETGPSDLWDDNTTVTITALRTFLIDFLKNLPNNQTITEMDQVSIPPTEQQSAPNTDNNKNAKAAAAYQSTAQHSSQNVPATPKLPEPKETLLQSKEMRDIYRLIDDLEQLENKGVQELEILRADTFLESLKNAVLMIKSKI